MSKHTTGELTNFCSVTVRTVQYYDTSGILTSGKLSEGGRQLCSEKSSVQESGEVTEIDGV